MQVTHSTYLNIQFNETDPQLRNSNSVIKYLNAQGV